MSIANPLTAGSEIQRSYQLKASNSFEEKAVKLSLGVFADDIVNISTLGQEKLQQETHIEATREIADIANEVIRVSSTIGRARSVGRLTNEQATALYSKIANLL